MGDLLVTETVNDAVDKFFEEMPVLGIKNLGVVDEFLGFQISLEDVAYVSDQEVFIELLV